MPTSARSEPPAFFTGTDDRLHCKSCGVVEGELHHKTCVYIYPDQTKSEPALPRLNIVIQLPPEVEQYAPDIHRFLDAMIYKLGRNAHKGRWEGITQPDNTILLQKEVDELTEAIKRGNMVEIMLEAADVANFALIASAIALEKK